MPKFQNSYSVQKIVYKQKCRCFCPIGKADYTGHHRTGGRTERDDPGLLRNRQVHSGELGR